MDPKKLQYLQKEMEFVCDRLEEMAKENKTTGDEMISILYLLAACYKFIRTAEPLLEKI